jgi:DNA-binding transcriptional regulator GbsR (MarR family)
MEKSAYNEMIRQLIDNKKRLLSEIELLDKAINSLSILRSGFNSSRLTDDIVADKTNSNSGRKNYYENVKIVVPAFYSKELQTTELFFYALNEMVQATVDELSDFILRIDATKNRSHITNRFRDIASGLYRAKKIYADTTKKKFKYSLKEISVKEVSTEERIINEIDAVLKI